MKKALLVLLSSVAAAPAAVANDTMAELKAGGLVYVQTTDVSMESEDLFISPDKVTVDYVFRNGSDKDVESYVAFPMPDLTAGPDANIAIGDTQSDNFLGFVVKQDGEEITPELQQRVYAMGIDMTDEVTARGVSLLPFSEATYAALEKLPQDVLSDWTARGLIFDDSYDAGKGWEHHPMPLWTLKSAYWWKTTFPAGREVRVHHEYKPGVGGTAGLSFIQEGKPGYSYDEYLKKYCMDDGFVKTATKLDKAASDQTGPYYTEIWISYVLTTGANWGGAIKHFKLTVDKGSPKNYISFCGEGVKKVGPTTFEMTAEDFYPQKDLDFLLLVPSE
ncbi:DUF4424 domain-containing protein [Ciceribacter ferrooxidans]|uniref:DUF4424 domain-containing protein n=1 Tax=Ciceribacter ferrooxidans TaxID=2509717 RepID=A0A4Q2S9B8_9HYPH|nr:DUF4424 domain-containing protein [Ciceribacter ferrooxidans]RYB97107.1 DUF4424 domain-containing protein [Ciceribacter ferrooxidans]